jgi:hypothetical protein
MSKKRQDMSGEQTIFLLNCYDKKYIPLKSTILLNKKYSVVSGLNIANVIQHENTNCR